jgi:hypothetical protein
MVKTIHPDRFYLLLPDLKILAMWDGHSWLPTPFQAARVVAWPAHGNITAAVQQVLSRGC